MGLIRNYIYNNYSGSAPYENSGAAVTAATAATAATTEELFEQSRSQSHPAQEKIHVSGNPSLRYKKYIYNPNF